MNNMQRAAIIKRRGRGEPISKIAKTLGLNVNTVKSFCRRQNITVQIEMKNVGTCDNCDEVLPSYQGGRRRRFCSDDCRQKYWSKHKKKYRTEHICPACGVVFRARNNRKYCSHSCYIQNRFESGSHV